VNRSRRLGVVMDPIESIKPVKDSTLAMLLEGQARGWDLHYIEPTDLFLRGPEAFARCRHLRVQDDLEHWYEFGTETVRALADLDIVLMRQDPPFDMEYVYSTYLLELAESQGARVFNRPRGIRDWNEKLAVARFPQFAPPTLVTRRETLIREFLAEHGDVILKPLDGMGGASVFRARQDDPNVNVIIETVTHFGRRTIMAQRYIPQIQEGDKRVLVIGGKAVPHSLARIPKPGETRGNLAAGGTGVAQALTKRDREIADALGPVLAKEGLLLAGLDVIGDWLTEVNVTSPTCFQEITEQTGFNVPGMFLDALQQALR
jgi:glutathione synthase